MKICGLHFFFIQILKTNCPILCFAVSSLNKIMLILNTWTYEHKGFTSTVKAPSINFPEMGGCRQYLEYLQLSNTKIALNTWHLIIYLKSYVSERLCKELCYGKKIKAAEIIFKNVYYEWLKLIYLRKTKLIILAQQKEKYEVFHRSFESKEDFMLLKYLIFKAHFGIQRFLFIRLFFFLNLFLIPLERRINELFRFLFF